MKRPIAFIHTSPAAIAPLVQFYSEAAPELEITNLLDDGILRLFAARHSEAAERRLAEMIGVAREAYGAEMALVTCSSVSGAMLEALRRAAGMPVLKIDEPMARQAVRMGRRIGVAVTFPPTLETTSQLLSDAAAEAGTEVEIVAEVAPEAYQALLSGDHAAHDDLLLAAIKRLDAQNVDAIVLAQVSMARLLPQLARRAGEIKAPVLSSLTSSLAAIREALH
ncbi:MAG: aspartate/glutamate racemase family protein [Blastocatellia bacterium]